MRHGTSDSGIHHDKLDGHLLTKAGHQVQETVAELDDLVNNSGGKLSSVATRGHS